MSDFMLTGSDVFGRYCRIEQFRYYSPNEMYLYKVIASLCSNTWCEVPYKTATKEVRHDHMEPCVLAICCGIDETNVQKFRVADVEFVSDGRERVVRCRDCKFYYGGGCTLLDFSLRDMEDGYCAWSEPREEG